jgi:hypothetical protein
MRTLRMDVENPTASTSPTATETTRSMSKIELYSDRVGRFAEVVAWPTTHNMHPAPGSPTGAITYLDTAPAA